MKTTLDLPDELMRAVKIRAVEENRTMTDLISEFLRRGLAQEPVEPTKIRHRVKLPLIHATHAPEPSDAMSPDRVAEILLDQETEAYFDSLR